MRVDILTLTTASAAALTIGLASPALGAGTPYVGSHTGARHLAAAHDSVHRPALAYRDGDDDGDDGGADVRQHHCDGGFCGGFRHRGCSSASCFGGFGHGGPFFLGGAGGGGGEDAIAGSSGEAVRVPGRPPIRRLMRRRAVARPMPRRVRVVPRGAVPTGFGGSQGSGVPLSIAGLSLILGGAGLLVARRRTRTSARS